jgi:aminomethyltransferase
VTQRTALFQNHLKINAKIVDFSGWEMPLHYGSQLEEHHIVRNQAGMFDVSHMCVIDLSGQRTTDFLRYLLANDVAKLTISGKALYSCMLNETGGIIDDLIVYYINPFFYRLVVNAGTRQKDLAWIRLQAKAFEIDVHERTDLAIIAVQGPRACEKVNLLFSSSEQKILASLNTFQGMALDDYWLARTGYTGEDGYEIILPAVKAPEFWEKLLHQEIAPCGLGARDTLRLEAGLNLYGSDMDETTTPFESNLAWTVSYQSDRDFIGKNALKQQTVEGLPTQLVGLLLEEKGVMRNHQKVILGETEHGEITSGTFSPSLQKSIAFARIAHTQEPYLFPLRTAEKTQSPLNSNRTVEVDIRSKLHKARLVLPPFVRKGKNLY